MSAVQRRKNLKTRVLEQSRTFCIWCISGDDYIYAWENRGAKNANLPLGDTYENNAYTRYLKKLLNIQNQDVFELEDGTTYEQAVEMAIQDKEIPDVLIA